MKKLLAMLLAAVMVLSMAACGSANPAGTTAAGGAQTAGGDTFKDPYADIADYDELSAAVYADVLGEFNKYYEEALAESNVSMRRAKMAIAEAKLLGAGIFLPTTSKGGNYAMTKITPYTNTPILFGNDTYRFHDRIVTNEPIKAEDIAAMKAKWVELAGSGEYEAFVKSYLTEKGYTTRDTATFYFDADPTFWDVLATSYAADSEILVHRCSD